MVTKKIQEDEFLSLLEEVNNLQNLLLRIEKEDIGEVIKVTQDHLANFSEDFIYYLFEIILLAASKRTKNLLLYYKVLKSVISNRNKHILIYKISNDIRFAIPRNGQKLSSVKILIYLLYEKILDLDDLSSEVQNNDTFSLWFDLIRCGSSYLNIFQNEKLKTIDSIKEPIALVERDPFVSNEVCSIIALDDLDSLRNFASAPGFNVNMKIGNMIYNIDSALRSSTRLIEAAAYFGSEKCFKYLLLNGANINFTSAGKSPVAINATISGNLSIIQILKEQDINFSGCSKGAIEYHNNNLLDWLLQEKCIDGNLLFVAAQHNNFEAVRFCVSKGIDINFRNQYQSTALHLAAAYDHPLMVKYLLLNPDIDVNAINKNLATPMIISCERNSLSSFKVLATAKKVNYHASKGKTPLLAAVIERCFDMVKYILSPEFETLDIDKEIEAFKQSIFVQEVSVLKAFLERGFPINIRFSDGYTLIDWATQLNCISYIELITSWPGFAKESLESAINIAIADKRKEALEILKKCSL